MEKRLRIQLNKLFIKTGFGLKSYNILKNILINLKKTKCNNSFKFIESAINKVLPFCIVKNVIRGKHKIVLLLPIKFNRAFRVAINSLKDNANSPAYKKINKNYSDNVTSEIIQTNNKESESYKRKLQHLKAIRFAMSFR